MHKTAILIALSAMVFALGAFAAKPHFGECDILVGKKMLHVQVADTDAAMETGLMYRDTLAPYDGMLFVFPKPQQVSFWMRDTKLPLDVGYFDAEGRLLEIHPLFPFEMTPVTSKSKKIVYALEMPSGDFVNLGLEVGYFLTYPYVPEEAKKASTLQGVDN